ncbi:MAG: PAS domain S-box protein [Chloroflexi bacterium]|nr:PAS domain S-box protein [Chloroflexota bacterium]
MRSRGLYFYILLAGLAFGALYWILSTVVAVYVFNEGHFITGLFTLSPREIWLRLLGAFIIIAFGIFVNIILYELNKAGRELRVSQEYARNLVDSSIDMIISVNNDRKIIEFNKAAQDTFGYTPEEVLGKHVSMLYAIPEQGESVYKTTIVNGRCFREVLNKRKNGEIFTSYVSASILRDAMDNKVGVMGISRDISERKRAEEGLKESEEKYRDLLENATDLIQSISPEGKIILVNNAWKETLGYNDEEIAGLSLFDVIHPDSVDHCRDVFNKVLNGGQVDNIEVSFITKDGRKIIVEGSANCKFENGKPVLTRGIFRNITEKRIAEETLRESEAKYSALVERANDIVAIIQDDVLKFVNPYTAKITGYSKDELLGMRLLDVIAPESREVARRNYSDRIAGRDAPTIYGTKIICKNGLKLDIEVSGGLIQFNGRPAVMAVGRDISERKAMEEAIRESEERFRNLMEYIPGVSIQGYLPNGKVVYWNKASEIIYGYNQDEALGNDLGDLIIPDDLKSVFVEACKIGAKVNRSGEFFPAGELLLKGKGGIPVPVYSIHTAVCTEGKVPLLFCIDMDLSGLKKAEEALRQSEEKYRLLVENIRDVIFTVDPDGRFEYVSPSIKHFLKYKAEDVMGRPFTDFVHQSDIENFKKNFKRILEGSGEMFEFKVIGKDGRILYARISARPFYKGDKAVGLSGVMNDISDLKIAENMLKKAHNELENRVKERTAELLESNRLLEEEVAQRERAQEKEKQYIYEQMFLSKAAMGFVGISPEDDIYKYIGQNFRELIGDCMVVISTFDEELSEFQVRAFLADAETTQKVNGFFDGNIVGLKLKLDNEEGRQNLLKGNLGSVPRGLYDLLEGFMAEDQVMGLEKELKLGAVYAMGLVRKGELIGSVVLGLHDGMEIDKWGIIETFINQASVALNRRLAEERILAYQKQLKAFAFELSTAEERERRRIAADLHDYIGQVLALIKMKLEELEEKPPSEISPGELGEIHKNVEETIQHIRTLTFDLSPPILYELGLVEVIEWLAEHFEKEHGILIELEDDGLPKRVDDGVGYLLYRTVRELLMNIIKHAGVEKAKISISKEEERLKIEVKDEGTGFNVSEYYSAHLKTSGFGLFNIRERLSYIGGEIKIESSEGQGTAVTIYAPLRLKKSKGD